MRSTVADLISLHRSDCCGCYGCENICPVHAVTFGVDREGFWYPRVDDSKCVRCGKCAEACPCRNVPAVQCAQQTVACAAKDERELMTSSSGGAFAVMARAVLQKGGYVCGAAFEDDFSVAHKVISTEAELAALKGTKYVQSRIGSVFSEIRDLLENGKYVLFSGTPCQVAGLKNFLGKEYEGLVTVDLICHGVPSPEVWDKYLDEISGGRNIIGVNFRNKENGIADSIFQVKFADGTLQQCKAGEDPYYKGFINDLYLRPSCFSCKFKGMDRCSDITIGDFWAVKEYYPDFDGGCGASAVILRTDRAGKLLDEAKDALNVIFVRPEEIATWNEPLLDSVAEPENRTVFFDLCKDKALSVLAEDLSRKSGSGVKKISPAGRIIRKVLSFFINRKEK